MNDMNDQISKLTYESIYLPFKFFSRFWILFIFFNLQSNSCRSYFTQQKKLHFSYIILCHLCNEQGNKAYVISIAQVGCIHSFPDVVGFLINFKFKIQL